MTSDLDAAEKQINERIAMKLISKNVDETALQLIFKYKILYIQLK